MEWRWKFMVKYKEHVKKVLDSIENSHLTPSEKLREKRSILHMKRDWRSTLNRAAFNMFGHTKFVSLPKEEKKAVLDELFKIHYRIFVPSEMSKEDYIELFKDIFGKELKQIK
jgi:hypothetical protein